MIVDAVSEDGAQGHDISAEESRHWKQATDLALVRYFEHENIWTKSWERVVNARAFVTDHHGGEIELAVWQASFAGRRKQFAAAEVSNGIWMFALPSLRP